MINLVASIVYVLSYVNGTHHVNIEKYDPCDKITSLGLAIGCSTVNGRRVYSHNKLLAIAKFPDKEFERLTTEANTENSY